MGRWEANDRIQDRKGIQGQGRGEVTWDAGTLERRGIWRKGLRDEESVTTGCGSLEYGNGGT